MEISIIITCLILCSFFSGMEIAFLSSNKIYLELEKKQHSFLSKVLIKLTEKPTQFIAAMLIGKNIALVVYGFFAAKVLLNCFESLGFHFSNFLSLAIQILTSALVIVLTSEFLPKVFFQIYSNSLFKFFALPAYIFYVLFYFVSTFILWISDVLFVKILNIEGERVSLFFSKIELGDYITEQVNSVEDHKKIDSEIQIFQNALEFSAVKARDIMTPRTEISAIEIQDSISNLKKMFIETGYSKLLVYKNSIDNTVGYVHSFELFRKPKTIKSVMISVEFVPETIFIKEVMDLLTKKRKSVAIVLDEYGGTAGLITIEDIVEELFGEIEDEHDSELVRIEKELEEGVYHFSTRLDVEYLNENYKFNIPECDSYGTLGGFIVNFTKEIPQKGEEINIGIFQFIIEEATNKKIELVKMTIRD